MNGLKSGSTYPFPHPQAFPFLKAVSVWYQCEETFRLCTTLYWPRRPCSADEGRVVRTFVLSEGLHLHIQLRLTYDVVSAVGRTASSRFGLLDEGLLGLEDQRSVKALALAFRCMTGLGHGTSLTARVSCDFFCCVQVCDLCGRYYGQEFFCVCRCGPCCIWLPVLVLV